MDAELWTQSISETDAPAYPCPHCGKAVLLMQPETFVAHATVACLSQQPDEGWDPLIAHYGFLCWLKCASSKCAGYVAVVGEGQEEPEWDEQYRQTIWERSFKPLFAWPMPSIFPIPIGCPKRVVAEIEASFRALWSDAPSAASRLRVAVEYLLDEIGVPRRRRTTSGYEALILHRRIEVLSQADAKTAANLMAIKWLGNTGSHEAAVSREDVLKAYEVMEHALDVLLEHRAKRATEIAKDLTRRHGKGRRRKRKAKRP